MYLHGTKLLLITAASTALLLANPINAKPPSEPPGQSNPGKPEIPPGQAKKNNRNPYFGDLHVHTARSLDAGLQGVITTPEQAQMVAAAADGIIVGSAIVKQVELNPESPAEAVGAFVQPLINAIRQG